MGLNGWQRLYVVLLLVVGLPLGVAGFYSMPNEHEGHYTGCEKPSYADPAEAGRLLATGEWREWPSSREPTCMFALREIADGTKYRQAMRSWRDSVQSGIIAFVILFGAIYLFGLGIGWVWRGFFPKKNPG
ncbi:MAG: hypothetical protein ACTHN1_08520 [Pseudoxanthomonas sp.]